jgi:hypothetical protein
MIWLFRNRQDTLKEIHLDSIDMMEGKNRTSLEYTVDEQLPVEIVSHVK